MSKSTCDRDAVADHVLDFFSVLKGCDVSVIVINLICRNVYGLIPG